MSKEKTATLQMYSTSSTFYKVPGNESCEIVLGIVIGIYKI